MHENYKGQFPRPKWYGIDQMKTGARKALLEWHKNQIEKTFDLQKELEEYCRSDVDILRRSMMIFRQEFMDLENIDPFCYVTIASVCMAIFRGNYLKEGDIAVMQDVLRNERHSKLSICWLDWISEKRKRKIQHALLGGEKRLECGNSKVKVDGFCEETNTAFEFQGCYWHGCQTCFKNETINSNNQLDMETLRKRTKMKNAKIRESGFELEEIYECELKKNLEFQKFLKNMIKI